MKEDASWRIRDERYWIDSLFPMMEAWKSPEGIFSNQGMYVVEILKRFDMLDCKSMATPMETNLKLLSGETLELVDMTHYRQIIGSLMYLMNTRPYICFVTLRKP